MDLAEGQETSLQVFQIEDQTKGAKKSLFENPVTVFMLIIVLKMIKYSTPPHTFVIHIASHSVSKALIKGMSLELLE